MKQKQFSQKDLKQQQKIAGCLFKFLFLPLLAIFLIGMAVVIFSDTPPPSPSKISTELQNTMYEAKNKAEFDSAFADIETLRDSTKNDSIKELLTNVISQKKDHLKSAKTYWRRDKINDQFSEYDGRHYILVSLVKDNMNDPGSFEHVKTDWGNHKEDSNKIVIYMEFRGKNAFGALVKNNVTAIADLEGNVLEIVN